MEHIFRIVDFNVYNGKDSSYESSDDEKNVYKDKNSFVIQMFGVDENGKTYSLNAEGFRPFFYLMVNDKWNIQMKEDFLAHLKDKVGKYYKDSITECKIIKRKKLYGFDGGKEHKFIFIEFSNLTAFNKVKNLWYSNDNVRGYSLSKNGYIWKDTDIKLYESNIPPLLRFFHIRDISPSGWIAIPKKKVVENINENKNVNCDFEFTTNYKNILPLNDKETRVPYKIMSFDIEASSSHGDFPVPIKTYKKLSTNIIEYFEGLKMDMTKELCKGILRRIILTAFGYENMTQIDLVYPKKQPSSKEVERLTEIWLSTEVRNLTTDDNYSDANNIENMFEKMGNDEEEDNFDNKFIKSYNDKKATIVDIICDKKFEREGKLNELNVSLNAKFPKLEGDKCTFIGSTFMNYGNTDPHFNHCIVLNTCSSIPINNSVVETYSTEKDVLLAWQQLVQRENPDIIIGYNIFGFDYNFMFKRAEENNCVEDFLKLSRNKDEICATKDKDTGKYKIEESTLQIASGQHDFQFIKMNGRLQVDLYNFYRREANLISYKLDYVAGNFIGDFVKELDNKSDQTVIKTSNMTGLLVGSYIHFEEIGHSVDYYADGAKFIVTEIDKEKGKFIINGIVNPDLISKKVRWCLAKDDVTPKDIFRMTNGTADDRSVIAKYCIQDCNLVHYLFNKSDILTGFIEMAKICSVPINFLVMRGQGIKLTSYVAKKCREKRTLMPVIEKGGLDEGYEGAIVLEPKCDLYLDNPVACNDYASLYPSSMISENLSHDSKVWTLEYDLAGNLIEEWGEKNEQGSFIYDNLSNYSYVDVKYDTYVYRRKHPKAAAEKVLNGYKLCRFAQPIEGESEGIMPAILKELLKARKDTRKLIPQQTDEFMKNVLDQRQLGYKVTANSLYGQCGAKTSTFYEKDIAACTTATGRKLLTYGKRIVEECYGNNICDTKNHGKVRTRAEYIYGDTDSVFYTFNLEDLDGTPIRGKKALEITIELAQQVGDVSAKFLKSPHDFEYEKTFMPFCLLSKKRYVGMKYESDPEKCKRNEMGIVLKRRDNAPIVKDIYGGIIDILMKKQNIQEAIDFLRGCLQNIVEEKYPMEKLIITKSLRSGYKNPQSIAHKVLADRITARDPGNKPGPGDRIPFAYITNKDKKALQGEKIETPSFITENNLKIDYSFYITNQIMKPVQQVFALVLEKIWTMNKKLPKIRQFKKDVESLRKEYVNDSEKFEEKLETMRCKEIKVLLFDDYLRETNNEKGGVQSLDKYFIKK